MSTSRTCSRGDSFNGLHGAESQLRVPLPTSGFLNQSSTLLRWTRRGHLRSSPPERDRSDLDGRARVGPLQSQPHVAYGRDRTRRVCDVPPVTAHDSGTSALLLAATKTAAKSSSGPQVYFILILFVGFYFFYLRPRRAKMLARQAALRGDAPAEIQPGDTILTTSGIIGHVLSIDGDRASVEVAPDTVIEIHRTALGRRLDPEAPDEGDRWASLVDEGGDPPADVAESPTSTDNTGTEDQPHDDGDVEHPDGAQ